MTKSLLCILLIIGVYGCKEDDAKPEMYDSMTLVYRVTTPNDGKASISYHLVDKYDYKDSLVYFAPNVIINSVQGRTEWVFSQEVTVGDMAQVLVSTRDLDRVNIEIWVEKGECKRDVAYLSEGGTAMYDTGGIFLTEEVFYKCKP